MKLKTNINAIFVLIPGVLLVFLISSACSAIQPLSRAMPTPTPLAAPPTDAAAGTTGPTQTPASDWADSTGAVAPTPESLIDPSTGWVNYFNDSFGLSFAYPSTWHGPDVTKSEDGLRLAIGSDVVYPYGTDRTEQVYQVENSYYVTIQYNQNKNDRSLEEFRADSPWMDPYFALLDLNNGESLPGPRSLVTRVRQLKLGNFEGVEYVSTLPETAQTERFYVREVTLLDEHLNTLRITGTPNNVQVANPDEWRAAYSQVDQANLETFYQVLESISID